MRRLLIVLCILSVGVRIAAQDGKTQPAATAKAAVDAANKAFTSALQKRDAAAIGALYTTNAEAFPPNGDIVRGRAAIQKMWQGVLDSGVASADLATLEVHADGNLAYEVGTYTMNGKDAKPLDKGKYVVVWMKEDGAWKIHRDIWNTSMAAPK
jgi:uncharacterized protein (TIGR02246 family)